MSELRKITRRQFLGQASCGAISSTALFSTLLNLRMASTAAAQTTPTPGDYRALVCLFFGGGSDSFNMLVPYGQSEYNEYAAIRADLAIARDALLPLSPLNNPGRLLAHHPAMPELASLFHDGRAAWVANVGTLVQPTSKAQLEAESVLLPLGLYSHSDQIRQWQTSVPQSTTAVGWGGRAADLLTSLNRDSNISMNISIAGNNFFQTGREVFPYVINSSGSVGRQGYNVPWSLNPAMTAAIDSQLALQYQNLFQQTFANTSRNAIDAHLEFSAAVNPITINTAFGSDYVSRQLRMVARTIAARRTLGMRRQTFFVSFGGWDHHDEVINNMNTMLPIVSQSIRSFHDAMVEIGEAANVTLFTASDFGRTLTSNGAGSDHAWGGNHLVVGGAVNGRRVFGQYPDLFAGNPLDTDRGRLIPTTSVDEYFAELALWFGVQPQDLSLVLPNIGNFYTPGSNGPLGFMNLT